MLCLAVSFVGKGGRETQDHHKGGGLFTCLINSFAVRDCPFGAVTLLQQYHHRVRSSSRRWRSRPGGKRSRPLRSDATGSRISPTAWASMPRAPRARNWRLWWSNECWSRRCVRMIRIHPHINPLFPFCFPVAASAVGRCRFLKCRLTRREHESVCMLRAIGWAVGHEEGIWWMRGRGEREGHGMT